MTALPSRPYDEKVVAYLDDERQRLALLIEGTNHPAVDWYVRRLLDVSQTLDRYIEGGS